MNPEILELIRSLIVVAVPIVLVFVFKRYVGLLEMKELIKQVTELAGSLAKVLLTKEADLNQIIQTIVAIILDTLPNISKETAKAKAVSAVLDLIDKDDPRLVEAQNQMLKSLKTIEFVPEFKLF